MQQPRGEYATEHGRRFIALALEAAQHRDLNRSVGNAQGVDYFSGMYDAYVDLANKAEAGWTLDELRALREGTAPVVRTGRES